jgi:VWFA-related protein
VKKVFLIFLLLIFPIYLFGQVQTEVKPSNTPKPEPISFAIVVDNSGSFYSIFKNILNSAKTIVNSIEADDEAFTIGFVSSGKITLYQDFTQDKVKLNRGIEQMFVSGGATAIWDAVYLSAKHLVEKSKTDESRKKYLVLITDGEDRDSQTKFEELSKYLQDNKIKVFAVGVVEGLSDKSSIIRVSPKEIAMQNLKALIKETSGKIYFAYTKQQIELRTDELIKSIRSK